MTLSQSVQQRQFSQYLDNVKKVGLELRHLLAAVDFLVPAFPSASHKQVSGSAVYFELSAIRIRGNFSAIAISFPRMRGRELSANFKFDHLTSGKFCSFRRIALLSPVFLPFYATLRKIAKSHFRKDSRTRPSVPNNKVPSHFQLKITTLFFQVEMAHKVLSKDMSELVHAMKLVQKYFDTTVEGEYRK